MDEDHYELLSRGRTLISNDQSRGPASPLDEAQQLLRAQAENCNPSPTPHGVSAIPPIRDSMQRIQRKPLASSLTLSTGRIWRTGIFRNVPWVGLTSLLVAFLSTAVSAIVLATSNQVAVANWSVSPHVMLAILSVVMTSCLKVSLSNGVTITWWHRLVNAAPLVDTHRSWDFGNNLWAAATAGKHFNFISLATILVALAMLESPLIQKASTVATRQISKPVNILASLAANLPSGYTATATGEYFDPTTPSAEFSEVFNDYSIRATIGGSFQGCPGTCEASIPGVGFKVDCQQYNTSFSMEGYGTNPEEGTPQFVTNTSWSSGCYGGCAESLTLNAGWAINTLPLAFVNKVCNLSLAVVSYPLSFANGTASFSLPLGTNPEVLTDLPSPLTAGSGDTITKLSTLGGFSLLGGTVFSSGPFYANVSMHVNGALALFTLYGLNAFAWSHAVNPNWEVMQYEGYNWRDPTPDTLAAYHEIMFRLAMKAAANATFVAPIVLNGVTYSSLKNVSATYSLAENYYVSDFAYLAGAMALIVVTILGVLPT
jgi:hypothetical protein